MTKLYKQVSKYLYLMINIYGRIDRCEAVGYRIPLSIMDNAYMETEGEVEDFFYGLNKQLPQFFFYYHGIFSPAITQI